MTGILPPAAEWIPESRTCLRQQIKVKVTRPGLTVRAREGYYAQRSVQVPHLRVQPDFGELDCASKVAKRRTLRKLLLRVTDPP